jgi:hypothetical protein
VIKKLHTITDVNTPYIKRIVDVEGKHEMATTYRIDVDGTIAEPKFFDDDLRTCCDWYVREEIITSEEVTQLQHHHQLFLLPHVLVTHVPILGAVETLHDLVGEGKTLQYFTVRQAIDPTVCSHVHEKTRIWLRDQHFPCPDDVRFFWDAGEKLTASLEAREDQILLVDDRPDGLVQAYQKIAEKEPSLARQIRQRVKVLAFGFTDISTYYSSSLRVIHLPSWSSFWNIRAELERESLYGNAN